MATSIYTEKSLKKISAWQVKHGKDDDRRFEDITKSLAKLPTQDVITDAIEQSIKTTVNGKIDKIALHLTEQDKNMEALSKKIRPFDQAKTWIKELAQVIMYVGGLAIAIGGIIELLRLMHVIQK